MSSTFSTNGVANNVGFGTVALLSVADGGIDWVKFCDAAVAASARTAAFDIGLIVAAYFDGTMEQVQKRAT